MEIFSVFYVCRDPQGKYRALIEQVLSNLHRCYERLSGLTEEKYNSKACSSPFSQYQFSEI